MDEKMRRWHKEQVASYTREKAVYDLYSATLDRVFRSVCAERAPLAIVQARPKSIPSFAEKAIRKAHKYVDPTHQLTDLCGARVITITLPQMDEICKFVEESFTVDWANTVDVSKRIGVMEFGYRSMHYVVQLKANGLVGEAELKRIGDRKAEIQVRTVLMHAWSEISHDRIYKNAIRVPEALQRQAARLAAVIEEAERSFADLVERIDSFVEGHTAYLEETRLREEIDLLTTILESEKDVAVRRSLALRAARLSRAARDWRGTERLLAGYERSGDADILHLLGEAICQSHANHPMGRGYARGLRLLDQASELIPENADLYAVRAECVLRQPNRLPDVRALYQKAYQADPSSPYTLASFLEYEVSVSGDAGFVANLNPAIKGAIGQCRQHIDVGIEIPRAHFTLAKLHSLTGDRDDSVEALLRGIDKCLDPACGAPADVLREEYEAIGRLKAAGTMIGGGAWWGSELLSHLRALLLIAMILKSGDRAETKKLAKAVRGRFKCGQRLLIIAGGCRDEYETPPAKVEEALRTMLEPFDGVVIGGGTATGIPGLVGKLADGFRKKKRLRFSAVGYLPGAIPAKVRVDRRYDRHVETDGRDFTIFEPIQTWIDIISSGIAPSDVRLICLNGGGISALEMRLALALGAEVCAPSHTGRSASLIHQDPAWSKHVRLYDLPIDGMIWRAFLLAGSTALSADQLESVGERIHDNYLATSGPIPVDPSHRPWGELEDGLKQSNRAQAAFAERILNASGFVVRPASSADVAPIAFTEKEIEAMAEMEHGRWMFERFTAGWRHGKTKDTARKTSPHLVPWNELDEKTKDYDREAVSGFPGVLALAGLEVCRVGDG